MSLSGHTDFNSEPTPLGLFARIPQEIRDMIYEPLISEGHIAITRASKALHQNTKLALHQHGVFRIFIVHDYGRKYDAFALFPQLQIVHDSDIRNLRLSFRKSRHEERVSGVEWKEETLVETIHGLMAAITDPRSCVLNLDPSDFDFIIQEKADAFALLRVFKSTSNLMKSAVVDSLLFLLLMTQYC
jgi:hypothetical protein